MHLECQNCKVEFNSEDIAHTLKNGKYKCPVCGTKIPDPLSASPKSTPVSINKYILLAAIFLIIVTVLSAILFIETSR